MSIVKAVVGLGVKGSDVVLSTFKKINDQKKQFEKPVKTKVTAMMEDKRGGVPRDDEERRGQQDQNKSLSNIQKNTEKSADVLRNMASGAASLNPLTFMQSITSSLYDVLGEVSGGILNALWTGSGEATKAIIKKAGTITNLGMQAGAGSLDAYKQSLGITKNVQSLEALIGRAGVGGYSSMRLEERAQLAGALLPAIGKVGDEFGKQLDRLFGGKNSVMQRQQAMSFAQGDFSSLGSTKGWILNQLSQSMAGAPPELQQAFRSKLIQSALTEKEGLAYEPKRFRQQDAEFQRIEFKTQARISEAGMKLSKTMTDTNTSLDNLKVNLVSSASSFTGALNDGAKALNKFFDEFKSERQKALETAKKKAKEAEKKEGSAKKTTRRRGGPG